MFSIQCYLIQTTGYCIITLIIAASMLPACESDNEDELKLNSASDYLIFGHFYGECGGESCVEIFRLDANQLREDTKDQYPDASSYYDGTFVVSHDDKFSLVKDLPNFLPDNLLEETEGRIGEPDAGDWGGLYIEYHYNGIRKFWLIDQKKSNVPEYLHEFIDKVNEKISLIQHE